MACAGHRQVNSDDAYSVISPMADLPPDVSQHQPDNLYIKINNVANQGSSYKNYVELYVNNYLIVPDREITNIKNNYIYKLRLQPGIYDIKAKYFASTGWKVKSFAIETKEKVKIFPQKKAIMKIYLKKNSWGGLKDKKNYFQIRYEKIKTNAK